MFLVSKHILNLQIARNQEYPGIVVRCKAICFWARNCQKKFQRLGIPFNHIRSSWFAFVQRIIPMFSTNSTFFSQKSRLCVRSDTSAFSVIVIVSPYFQTTIVPRNFFKKKVLWVSLQEPKNRKRKVKSKQKPPLQLQIWLAEIFPPTFLLA